jgi:hypothetical protein
MGAGDSRFAAFGNANLEVVAAVGDFPVVYAPDRLLQGGPHSGVSGVAVNVATALAALGNAVTACVTIGRDPVAAAVAGHIAGSGLTVVPADVDEQPVTWSCSTSTAGGWSSTTTAPRPGSLYRARTPYRAGDLGVCRPGRHGMIAGCGGADAVRGPGQSAGLAGVAGPV